ncbi:hypothetical protein OG978_19835 [Streptomyces sp. NBC_01591]|uniref:hypothetical protein n=1 Tax=Streptomyces sp. NBC_01591 TaxID=2975888 RepID=UPI002DDC4538|nr:hypothetical protein [Streptomyces sp. NBC_01591]WSD69447.1 hypothetical protein OG978_19835 [Streptomyces sp. NBC_01591]
MRLKRVGRMGATGGLVAAALATSIVITPSSASAADSWQCYGKQVKRCATVSWDNASKTFRAKAKITDVAGGGNYQVKVTNVKLERYPAGKRVTMRTTKDYDGWHSTGDSAATSAIDACKYPHDSYKVVATFSWKKGSASENKTWRPDMSWVGC